MVGRTDSLQTAPNLHDRMWELDGFGDYVKHSFHFQFIVRRRGITFTQMVRNLERHSFCATQNVYGKGVGFHVCLCVCVGGGGLFKDQIGKKGFQHFFKLALAFCSLHLAVQWYHILCHIGPSWRLLWSGQSILIFNWFSTHIHSILLYHAPSLHTSTY